MNSEEQNDLNQDIAEDESAAAASDESNSDELGEALSESGGDFAINEKKAANRGTMVLFGLVLAGMGATYLMFLKTGPKSADASIVAQTEQASQTINTFLNDGSQNIKTMESMLKNTEKVVQQFLNYPSMTQVPLSDLKTNPFRYAPLKPTAQNESESSAKKRREDERLAMLKAVQNLQLQSILHGDARKACMINNTLYQEGQNVEGFNIEKINPQGIIVKNGAYRYELKMQK